MKQTLLMVTGQLGVGGAERQLSEILPQLVQPNRNIVVYTLSAQGRYAEVLSEANISLISPPSYKALRACGVIGRGLLLLCSMCKLTVLIWRIKPALIHYYLPKAYLIGSICALLTPSRKLMMSRRSLNYYQKKHPWLAFLERKLHSKMSRILVNSRSVLQQMIKDEAVSEDRLRLIYNGVDLSKFSIFTDRGKTRSNLGISEKAIVFIIVANLYAYKGHVDLIRALSIARNDLPDNWSLLCVGRDENTLDYLMKLSKEYNLQDHIHWLGERNDVPELLLASDIGILCSHQEGFSNSILEGMAAKLPLVVTNVGGNSEAVLDGETAIVVPSCDPGTLSDALLCLASDSGLRKKMGIAGFQRVKTCFSLECCVDAYDALYSELMGAKISSLSLGEG